MNILTWIIIHQTLEMKNRSRLNSNSISKIGIFLPSSLFNSLFSPKILMSNKLIPNYLINLRNKDI